MIKFSGTHIMQDSDSSLVACPVRIPVHDMGLCQALPGKAVYMHFRRSAMCGPAFVRIQKTLQTVFQYASMVSLPVGVFSAASALAENNTGPLAPERRKDEYSG